MYRLIYIASIFISFARDYVASGEDVASAILSVMLIEYASQVALRPIFNRCMNSGVFDSPFFSKKFILFYLPFLVLFVFALLLALLLVMDELVGALIFSLPMFFIYKYFLNAFLFGANLRKYYLFEFFRNASLLAAFYSGEYWLYPVSIAILAFIVIKIYFVEHGFQRSVKSTFSIDLYFQDWLVILQAGMGMSSYMLDKLVNTDGEFYLQYLLITKFVVFSVGFLGAISLQEYHVSNRDNLGAVNFRSLTKKALPIFVFILGGYFILFGCVIDWLPVSDHYSSDVTVVVLGAVWLGVMLVRELFIKVLLMHSLYNQVSKILVFNYSFYYLVFLLMVGFLLVSSIRLEIYYIALNIFCAGIAIGTLWFSYDKEVFKKK